MQNRRETLRQSLAVAGLLGATGLFPQYAFAFTKSAFEAKSVNDAVKAYGASAPVESKDVTLTAPDIAENGAVVPMVASELTPFFRSDWVSAVARWIDRRTLSTRSSRLSPPPASCWNWYSCSPASTTFARWL